MFEVKMPKSGTPSVTIGGKKVSGLSRLTMKIRGNDISVVEIEIYYPCISDGIPKFEKCKLEYPRDEEKLLRALKVWEFMEQIPDIGQPSGETTNDEGEGGDEDKE